MLKVFYPRKLTEIIPKSQHTHIGPGGNLNVPINYLPCAKTGHNELKEKRQGGAEQLSGIAKITN